MQDNTFFVIVLILIAIIYMVPTLIAFARDHRQRHTIAVINLLFGWIALVPWLITFFWALFGETEPQDV